MNFANLYTVKSSIYFNFANYLYGNMVVIILIVNQSSKFVVSTFMRLNQSIGCLFPSYVGWWPEVTLIN